MSFKYKSREEILKLAETITCQEIQRLYDEAILASDDRLADVMSIEAVWLYLNGKATPETDAELIQYGIDGGYKSFNVTISTKELVPVYVPNDGATIYSIW